MATTGRRMTRTHISALDCFRLDGRTAFLSGAAGHLGRAMAFALSDAGAHVILNGRDEKRLTELANEMARKGGKVETATFDVGDLRAVREFFGSRKRLDVIINNAVTMTPRPFAALSEEEFAQTYRTGVTAPFEIVRAALPALRRARDETGDASVVNIASMYGMVAPDSRLYSRPEQSSPLHYGPAKAALMQLTRHLASELGREHIRVNALAPGPFPRESVRSADPAFVARLGERTMLGRTGEPAEITGPLLFLASAASSFVTGSTLTVDGGWTVW
jgi:NAD(P)-dependent dehydrogenase (short-subunit alcohol dehydrogenase family)